MSIGRFDEREFLRRLSAGAAVAVSVEDVRLGFMVKQFLELREDCSNFYWTFIQAIWGQNIIEHLNTLWASIGVDAAFGSFRQPRIAMFCALAAKYGMNLQKSVDVNFEAFKTGWLSRVRGKGRITYLLGFSVGVIGWNISPICFHRYSIELIRYLMDPSYCFRCWTEQCHSQFHPQVRKPFAFWINISQCPTSVINPLSTHRKRMSVLKATGTFLQRHITSINQN